MELLEQGTKERIFTKAIELFSLYGYENVSMKKIAAATGIAAASIYNHFESKELLLDDIFRYYEDNLFKNCKPDEEMQHILAAGSARDIVRAIAWNFYGLPEEVHSLMTMITKIIYERFLIDDKANAVFCRLMSEENLRRKVEALTKLVALGRLDAGLDVTRFCEILNYVCLMIGIDGIANQYSGGLVNEKTPLKTMLADFLAHYMME